ncbi:MAG: hypothetical protein K2K57_06930 [Oscillospiraceae bacterium]|nr:hypothetical protein [Oscillospiraceae bacterium]
MKRILNKVDIPGLMTYVVITMAVVFIGDMVSGFQISGLMFFVREYVFAGQIWRAVTFMLMPIDSSVLWVMITLMFYYGIGRDLEAAMGSRRFTHYMLLGWLFTMLGGFIAGYASNTIFFMSLFCAYAVMNPDDIIMMMFVIPCKAKWLAFLDAVYMGWTLIFGGLAGRLMVLAALAVFVIFFGRDYIRPVFDRLMNRWKHRDFIRTMRRKNIRVHKGGKNGER